METYCAEPGIDLSKGGVSFQGKETLEVLAFELLDLFLIATTLYIVALGLYGLFIDSELPVPSWMKISRLRDLKIMLSEGLSPSFS